MKTALTKISGILDKITGYIVAFILAAISLIIVYSVVMRFIFNSPVQWQYELTLLSMSWMIFLGMPMAFHKEEHMNLTFVASRLSPKLWWVYKTVIDLALIAFLAIGFKESISVMQSSWSTLYQTIPVSKGWFYMAFPVGCAISIVHLVTLIVNRKPEDAPKLKEQEA